METFDWQTIIQAEQVVAPIVIFVFTCFAWLLRLESKANKGVETAERSHSRIEKVYDRIDDVESSFERKLESYREESRLEDSEVMESLRRLEAKLDKRIDDMVREFTDLTKAIYRMIGKQEAR